MPPVRTLLLVATLVGASELGRQGGGDEMYFLPFPVGDTARLIQGPNGPWGHSGHLAWSWDFVMPIGSPVIAARAGTVVAAVEQFVDFTRKPGEENYIVVAHGDSTFARYYHLTTGGALAGVGDTVAAGDTIGRSGSTGASAGPHLHFDVTRDCPAWGCQTIPISFANAGSDSLVAGRTYRALPASR